MVSDKKDIRGDFSKFFIFAGIISFVGVLSVFVLTAGRGLDSPDFVKKAGIFFVFALIGLLGLFSVLAYNFFSGRRMVQALIHEPELSPFGGFKVVKSPVLLGVFSFVLFFPVVFIASAKQVFFSSIPVFTSQTITKTGYIWADAVFPAIAENLLWLFVITLMLLVVNLLFKDNGLRGLFKWFVVPVVFSFLWAFVFHSLVYGSDELSLVATFFFALVSIYLMFLTFSCIPWFIIHFLTNFGVALKVYGLFGNDLFIALLWFLWFVLLVFGFYYLRRLSVVKRGVRA